jgi:hypothetical protein
VVLKHPESALVTAYKRCSEQRKQWGKVVATVGKFVVIRQSILEPPMTRFSDSCDGVASHKRERGRERKGEVRRECREVLSNVLASHSRLAPGNMPVTRS